MNEPTTEDACPHWVTVTATEGSEHPGHVCFSHARYDGLRDWWDGLDDDEKRGAYLVEKGNADALAASILAPADPAPLDAPGHNPITFSGTVVAWPDGGRQITVEVGPDCYEYPSIGERVNVTRRQAATPAPLDVERLVRAIAALNWDGCGGIGCPEDKAELYEQVIAIVREYAALEPSL